MTSPYWRRRRQGRMTDDHRSSSSGRPDHRIRIQFQAPSRTSYFMRMHTRLPQDLSIVHDFLLVRQALESSLEPNS